MKLIHTLIVALLLMFAGAASAGTADVAQVGDTIYVWGSGWADLTYVETQVSNASALTHTGTIFLAGANIHVNGTGTTLYINDSDCSHLRLNCSFGDVSDLRVDGYFEMVDSKITSWNTSTVAVVTQTALTRSTQRSCMRFGDDSNNCYANITDSEISHLGYNTSNTVWGISLYRWNDGEFRNVDIHHLYSIYMIRCVNDCYNHTKIYNNSARGLEIYHFSHYLNIINTDIYYNNHLSPSTAYGAGIWTNGEASDHMYIYNCTVRDNYGAQLTLQAGDNATVAHSKCYGNNRLLELNGVTNSVCEYNTCWDGWRGLYNVHGYTNTYRHNAVWNCTSGGIVVYGVAGGSCMMWNNTAYNNEYNILFVSDSAGTKICNETISGASTATGVDICCDDGYNDAQVQDLNNYDNELSVRLWRAGRSLALNYTTNKIMNVTRSLTHYESTNTYYTDHSSLWARKTANEAPPIISMYLYNGTLTAATDNVTIERINEWNEAAGTESYNITVNSTNTTEVCTFTANVSNSTDMYGCYVDGVKVSNIVAVGGVVSWTYTGGFSAHTLEIRWEAADTNRYVATWGDNNAQGNITHPWQSVSYATQQAVAGDTIHLFNGTWYDEHVIFANSGNVTHHITLSAYNGTPTLDGGDKTGNGIRMLSKSYIDVIGPMLITDYATATSVSHCDYINISNIEMDGNWTTGDPDGVSLVANGYSNNVTISNCTIHDSAWNTVTFYGNREPPHGTGVFATNFTIKDCKIYNSSSHATIDFYGNSRNLVIEGCELWNNPKGCIYTHDGDDHREYMTIRDNYFHDTLSIPINVDETSYISIYNNTFEDINTFAIWIPTTTDIDIYNNSFKNSGSLRCNIPNTVFDDNYIEGTSQYQTSCSTGYTLVKNPTGFVQLLLNDPSGKAELLFDDGTVFTASYYWLGSYVPVRYYPEKSNTSGVAKVSDHGTITVTLYNITLNPTSSYLKDVTVNHESNTSNDYTNISVNSNISMNPTWINVTMQNASANYSVSVDGNIVKYITADSDAVIHYQYTSSWSSPHIFKFNWAGTFIVDHTKSYYSIVSPILNTANSTGYVKYDRMLGWNDTVCDSGSLKVMT